MPASGAIARSRLTGTLVNPYRARLVQTAVSTRLVQCLLGVMALCALLSPFSMDTTKVLPKNPCSIAGIASLLADSTLLSQYSLQVDESATTGDQALQSKDFLGEQSLRLGWHYDPITRDSDGADMTAATAAAAAAAQVTRRRPLARGYFGIDVDQAHWTIPEAKRLTCGHPQS